MRSRHLRRLSFVALTILIALVTAWGYARAQVQTPRSEELRFQTLLHEPIATPDRRGVVAGTSALLLRDRRTGQCFVAVTLGDSMAMAATGCGN
jgi:hypothetical protein